ncbi:MAG: nucleotidyltransferase domain-containing protein [Oscillospiraceae bacterium]|jgi:hypothetical protein|nr:nucleotidyltransferase domain-containing protein [Oscillospiraceae bacterium]
MTKFETKVSNHRYGGSVKPSNNNDKIVEIILNVVKEKYKDDVSLVCIYGSYVNGTANEKSDVDFYFVPKTERAWELTNSFIVNGIGYDFWGVNWERLEKMANFDDTFVSLIDEARIVYSHSAEDEERFNELKQRITKTIASPVNADMLSKTINKISEAEKSYFKLVSSEDMKVKRQNAGWILVDISDAVCLMNNSFLRYGTKRHLEELSNLKNLPENFIRDYKNIISAKQNADIENTCLRFIISAKKLHDDLHGKIAEIAQIKEQQKPKDCLSGLYEEISSNWNKLVKACDENNAELAFITGVFLQDCLDNALCECGISLIDFLSKYDSENLGEYMNAAKQAEEQFVSYLKEYQIPIKCYDSVLELENALFKH